MWNIGPIQIQAISYIHTNIYRTYTQKWDCKRRPREEGEKIVNNNEIYHICIRARYNETLETLKQHRIGRKW
jgi:hypothetical protein